MSDTKPATQKVHLGNVEFTILVNGQEVQAVASPNLKVVVDGELILKLPIKTEG
jgi:hypothetical protein